MPGVKPITFLVPGQDVEAGRTRGAAPAAVDPALSRLGDRIKQSVVISTQRAAGGQDVPVAAVPGEDVVVLHVDRGPVLVLHPENARDLLLAQGGATRGGTAADGEVPVPVRLQWRGLEGAVATRGTTRGFLGDVMLKAVEIITGKVVEKAADFGASAIVKKFDGQVTEGVYPLSPDSLGPLKGPGRLDRVPAPRDGGPILVLVHGTFSTTSSTFGKLWTDHPQRVRALFDKYKSAVYALEHATLGRSPIDNALTLAEALPAGAEVHLLTHSRGGLVAEVLARLAAGRKETFQPFAGSEYRAQRETLRSLAGVLAGPRRGVKVSRVVRVACPARGTLLASKRLDAYISVFKWTLELAGIPVVDLLVDLLAEVARRRADPGTIPGLAAQIPDSPLVQWLHEPEVQVAGDLRVVAGDIEGDSITTWLKTLLADAFYWTDNDLVVQTRSMYGGTPREKGATYLLDQGGKVTHFGYFGNDRTAGAIVSALTEVAPRGFGEIGPLSWAGESATGTRAAMKRAGEAGPGLPAVFLLPGILGSHLGIGGHRIWLGWRVANGLSALRYTAGQADRVEPDGPLGLFYDDIATFLSATHEVIPFAFDWRRPIEDEALRLAEAVAAALDARKRSGQPVRLLAHSMGGIVARTMEIVKPAVWARMMKHPGARLLMLGTPNGGSWAPMQMLSGDDTFGNLVVSVGAPFRTAQTRQLIAEFPGLIQLQAGLAGDSALKAHARWKELADQDLKRLRERSVWHHLGLQLDSYAWGVPPQPVLDRAAKLRDQLDRQAGRSADVFGERAVLVTGRAPLTPDGYELAEEGLVYLDVAESGDGRVTLESAMLPGVRTWAVDGDHGDLPRKRDAFAAYLELLTDGTTDRLPTVAAIRASRGGVTAGGGAITAPARVRSRPSRLQMTSEPPRRPGDVLEKEARTLGSAAGRRTPLRVTVTHGDLTFVSEPLLLGHYRAAKLTGTEAVMDRLLGGTMSEALHRGLYPNSPGEHEVFLNTRERPDNPWQLPRPKAVIVVGLGQEGSLRSADLVATVRQAVIGWSHRLAEQLEVPHLFSLAATLIGSGGLGMAVAEVAQLIAKGVQEANERLDSDDDEKRWPRVEHLNLIEMYLDRATEGWRTLSLQAASSSGSYEMTGPIVTAEGGLPRPLDAAYRGAPYDFISVTSGAAGPGESALSYSLDTTRARTEISAQRTQARLIQKLVLNASNAENADPLIGRTLFRLLVPPEIEAFLGGTTETQIELDRGTAGIPWELLDTELPGSSDSRPWAIRTKLLRKLRTTSYRSRVDDADPESGVLIIGEPQCDAKVYPALPAARREAAAVAGRFGRLGQGDRGFTSTLKTLIRADVAGARGPDARTILNAVMTGGWRIVHISGHGEPPERTGALPKTSADPPQGYGAPRGVVLSDDLFLGPDEIRNIRVVPELVFVNCCFLAERGIGELLEPGDWRGRPYNRAEFASTVADALIDIGVKCVIAAGWAVEDGPANVFATTFYDSLLDGRRFIDAVSDAREAARKMGGNTWAAYQCYGDPDWEFRFETGDAQGAPGVSGGAARAPKPDEEEEQLPRPFHDEFAGIASPKALALALRIVGGNSAFARKRRKAQVDRMRFLEDRFGARWEHLGYVAAAFGEAWSLVGDRAKAIVWLAKAREAQDGSAPVAALEKLANLQVRAAWDAIDKAPDGRARRAALRAARDEIGKVRPLLDTLLALGPTVERESLYGSAFKRLALIASEAGDAAAERAALTDMALHYGRAEQAARKTRADNLYYPAMNRMAAELALREGRDGGGSFKPDDIAAARESLKAAAADKPDFWSVVGLTELVLYEALAARALAAKMTVLTGAFKGHHERVPGLTKNWASVYDNATFVLKKYATHAPAAEKKAAAEILKLLQSFAAG